VACRDIHLKTLGLPDSWAALKALGANGVEVVVTEDLQCSGLFHPQKEYSVATADGISALKEDLERNGLRITAFCMNNRLDETLERELAWAKQLVAVAQKMAVRAIRIDVVPRAIKAEEYMPFAIKACKQLCDLAKDTPVRYGIENHGHWTNRPEVLEGLFDGVGSEHLGLTLDAMNFYWFGHPLKDLYRIYEKFASRVYHTHCKNLSYPEDKKNTARPIGWEYEKHAAPLYDGDIDYQRVATILAQAKYDGDLCLENECLGRFPKDQHAEILKKEIALLRKLV
jgi:sugar phosphate isomerase/epimerase